MDVAGFGGEEEAVAADFFDEQAGDLAEVFCEIARFRWFHADEFRKSDDAACRVQEVVEKDVFDGGFPFFRGDILGHHQDEVARCGLERADYYPEFHGRAVDGGDGAFLGVFFARQSTQDGVDGTAGLAGFACAATRGSGFRMAATEKFSRAKTQARGESSTFGEHADGEVCEHDLAVFVQHQNPFGHPVSKV